MSTASRVEGASRLILLVEDEPVLRASMSRGLARLPNVEVVDAGSVADAKKLLGAVKPHLVVTDLDLPDGSGVEVISEIATLKLAIPIVVVSAYLRTRRTE